MGFKFDVFPLKAGGMMVKSVALEKSRECDRGFDMIKLEVAVT